jgi:acyl-ACP thioesterase
MSTSTAGVWTESFRVRSYEVTPKGTASVLVLGDYLQEAAGHHARDLGVSMQRLLDEGRAWVLAHLHLEIDRLPRWGETVAVATWPSGLDRLYATREFLLYAVDTAEASGAGPADAPPPDEAFARATSAWLMIDTDRRRPVRPPEAVRSIAPPDRPPALESPREDVPELERVDRERTFGVRYHDLDVNRHVNNVRYVEWAVETLPAAVHDRRRCTGLTLQFEAETTLDDTVHSAAQLVGDARSDGRPAASDALRVRHRLRAGNDGRTLARALTTWQPERSASNEG